MADGPPPKSVASSVSHTRSISLPNPLNLIPIADGARYSYDDAYAERLADGGRKILDNLIAIGQAAVEAANLQDANSDDELMEGASLTAAISAIAEGNDDSAEGATDAQTATVSLASPSSPNGSGAGVAEECSVVETESEVNYSLACPVCLENYYRPHRCHPCRHTFCEPCLCRLRKADMNHPTKCPLCREKIKKCTFDSVLSSTVASTFPEVYQLRHKQEKKQKYKLPPLPGVPISIDKYGRNMLATWSAVCAVVLLMMFVFTVFASFVGFVLWYTMEVMLDIIGELLMEASDFFSFSWQALIILWIEGKVPQEIKDILSGSVGRVSATMSRLVNRTKAFFADGEVPPPPVAMYVSYDQQKFNNSSQILTKMTQVNVANYVLLAGLFTYILYRIARYFQNGNGGQQEGEQRLRH